MTSEVLNSWKEIADYMSRGVRTVQRWEADLGLPVQRTAAKRKGAVTARKRDLDRWLAHTPCKGFNLPTAPRCKNRLSSLRAQREQMHERTQHAMELCSRTRELVRNAQELSLRIAKEKAHYAVAA